MNELTKEELLSVLRKMDVPNTVLLEGPEITVDILILAIKKFRISVPDDFFSYLADRLGLAYMERDVLLANPRIGSVLPYAVGEETLIALLESKPGYLKVATANPLDELLFARLQKIFGKKIEKVVVPLDAVITITDVGYQSTHAYSALSELVDRQPDESAYRILVPWQKVIIILLTLVAVFFILSNPYFWLFVFFTIINITYFVMNPVKFFISMKGLFGTKDLIHITDQDIMKIRDEDLPIYTILVPLFHEQEMLPHILLNIANLNYPREKLDVKILMEEEDTETLEKARKLGLFGNVEEIISPMSESEYHAFLSIFHPVVILDADIKTKPRACNYGLKRSQGEFVVIYDAEDFPDRDQLKKVVIAFRRLGPTYACVQCLLNFYNSRKNMLTRWFSIEYSYYYDFYIQGLDKIDAPIPLGGTSNHFRMKMLRDLGAWDPYNVTEDADLGMRIARKKLHTAVLNSYTYEEAVTKVPSWIKQRSRWVKGFVITWFVTMRHPIRLLKDIGLKNFLIFQTGFGGNFYLPLMNLFLWLVFAASFFIPGYFSRWFDFWPFAALAVFNLLVGNLFFLAMMLIATWKEKQWDLLLYALFSPIYWILMSIGAWKGTLQLIFKPYKWEKTSHGTEIIHEQLIVDHPERFSRPVKWIEVKSPELEKGARKVTGTQIGFSLVISILLILLALILFGIIEYKPISEHITVSKVPGLSQVLAPFEAYQSGEEVRLLNYEALFGPDSTPSPPSIQDGAGTVIPVVQTLNPDSNGSIGTS
ncbi:MAG: glycosyltransferase [Methanomicrobiales archaeon]|nr:glycosyltransferase [Methanomicrobiales archaeon]